MQEENKISNDSSKASPLRGGLEGAFPSGGGEAFPGKIEELPGGGIVLSKLDDIINWARSNSLWPLTFATSCCGIEMMSTAGARYDFSRFGFEVARATPRQADVIIIAGTIVHTISNNVLCVKLTGISLFV